MHIIQRTIYIMSCTKENPTTTNLRLQVFMNYHVLIVRKSILDKLESPLKKDIKNTSHLHYNQLIPQNGFQVCRTYNPN